MVEIDDELRDVAVRQYRAFIGGDPAFVDLVGGVFLDEGRIALEGRDSIARGFAGLLERNRRASAGRPAPEVEIEGGLDLDGVRALVESGAPPSAAAQLSEMLPLLAEGDVLLWLSADMGGQKQRFFNLFRREEGGWRVIGFGY